MRQTAALFLDAYRDLNARRLFWVTLALSCAIVLALAAVGVDADGISLFGWRWERDDAEFYYRAMVLSFIIVSIWLSWGAVILALISTAGIFPDLIASGAIDLYLSKPISRLRLFLTKYAAGMMFVTLQLTIFCTGCFVVVGLRAHEWRPSLFLAIPYVALLFSYIYAVCVLLGVWTRSTIAAVMLTILFYLMVCGVSILNVSIATFHAGLDLKVAHAQAHIRRIDSKTKPFSWVEKWLPGTVPKEREQSLKLIAEAEDELKWVRVVHRIAGQLHRVLPKMRETNNLLDRELISDNELFSEMHARGEVPPPIGGVEPRDMQTAIYEVQKAVRSESPGYIIGSSLICEAVVVALAAWIFCRRDY
jgi:ABC-type transport system involved in multi-copper enzyme maturation permease subunit